MKKILILILICCTLLTTLGFVVVSADGSENLNYQKIKFRDEQPGSWEDQPATADEMNELFNRITSYRIDPSEGMYVRIVPMSGKKEEYKTVIFPYGDLTIEYLNQFVADETIRWVIVGHAALPIDDDVSSPAVPTGDDSVYTVIGVAIAVAALVSIVSLRKKRI